MCFLEQEDFTRSIEVVIFPRVFYECVNSLVPDMAVMVQGKVNVIDDGIKLIADKVIPLSEYQPSYYLQFHEHTAKQEVYKELKEVMAKHKGNIPVVMYHSVTKQTQKMNERYWLNDDDDIIPELEKILGEGNIKIR